MQLVPLHPGTIDAAAMAAALARLQQQQGGGGGGGGGGRRVAGPGLSDILTPESVGPLLRSDDVRSRLLEHLPEEHRSTQDLEELVRTPQFQSQLERFSHALQSGQMDLAQFGLSPGTGFSVAEFLQAIQTQVTSEEGSKKGEGGGGDDNAMTE
jgi:26S proteasome regulatory subunit N13